MPWPSEIAIDFAAPGDNVVVPATLDYQIRVFQLFLLVCQDTELTFKDGAGTALTGPMCMLAHGSIVLDFVRGSREADQPWFLTSPGNAFIINSSNPGQVSGRLYYTTGTQF